MYADTMKDAWDRAKSVLDSGEVRTFKEVFRAIRQTPDKEWEQLYKACIQGVCDVLGYC